MDTNPSKQRRQFYRDYASGQWSMSELCDRYQVPRPTGYKWVERIENEGLKAVKDRSRAPFGEASCSAMPPSNIELICGRPAPWAVRRLAQC
jgi:transposase-like protein